MNQRCFELLASQPEWEEKCLHDCANIDSLPDDFKAVKEESRAWSFYARLLSTLTAWPKAFSKDDVATVAKNGRENKGKGLSGVKAYPGLVSKMAYGKASSPEEKWMRFSSPAPSLLDSLPAGTLLLKVDVELRTPFFSRDDNPFYPTENNLKRHVVFDAPYLAASSIKGLMRWAYRMTKKNLNDDAHAKILFGVCDDTSEDVSMFRKDDEAISLQGALRCYPLFWQGNLGLETINPQDRETGAGTNPIKYEVLRSGKGSLYFLLASLPKRPVSKDLLTSFLDALEWLLQYGGLSAKSSAGWGSVRICSCNAALRGRTLPKSQKEREKEEAEKQKKLKLLEEQKKQAQKASSDKENGQNALLSLGHPVTEKDMPRFSKAMLMALLGLTDRKLKMKKNELPALLEEERKRLMAEASETDSSESQASAVPQEKEVFEERMENSTKWLWPTNGVVSFEDFKRILLSMIPA